MSRPQPLYFTCPFLLLVSFLSTLVVFHGSPFLHKVSNPLSTDPEEGRGAFVSSVTPPDLRPKRRRRSGPSPKVRADLVFTSLAVLGGGAGQGEAISSEACASADRARLAPLGLRR